MMLKAMVVECPYLFLYPTSMHAVCMFVKGPTHLHDQLLVSSWLVLLHQKWKLVPSLKEEKIYKQNWSPLVHGMRTLSKRDNQHAHTLATNVWLSSKFFLFRLPISKTSPPYILFTPASSATWGWEWDNNKHYTHCCKEHCQLICPCSKFYNN